jgi:hypothetical protein
LEFIEARAFTKLLGNYIDDDEYRLFQALLADSPTAGDLIQRFPKDPLGGQPARQG